MAKKIFIGIFVMVLLLVLVGGIMFIPISPKWFSEDKHIENIAKKVDKRYAEYGVYSISPIVVIGEENTDSRFFRVEFYNGGFIFVSATRSRVGSFDVASSMYHIDEYFNGWQRYRFDLSDEEEIIYQDGISWKKSTKTYNGKVLFFESDLSGQLIYQNDSPYKIASLKNETKYLLCSRQGYEPIIKDGESYIDLITMQKIDCDKIINGGQEGPVFVSFFIKDSLG